MIRSHFLDDEMPLRAFDQRLRDNVYGRAENFSAIRRSPPVCRTSLILGIDVDPDSFSLANPTDPLGDRATLGLGKITTQALRRTPGCRRSRLVAAKGPLVPHSETWRNAQITNATVSDTEVIFSDQCFSSAFAPSVNGCTCGMSAAIKCIFPEITPRRQVISSAIACSLRGGACYWRSYPHGRDSRDRAPT